MFLSEVLKAAGLEAARCAELLGIHPRIFREWLTGARPITESYLPRLSNILSVSVDALREGGAHSKESSPEAVTPAIWFKFRGPGLLPADRECVLQIRELGFHVNELEDATGERSAAWRNLVQSIRNEVNVQDPPIVQGQVGARLFRTQTGLGHGAKGIGPVFRGYLRSQGFLVIESPIPNSKLEGCCFLVGSHKNDRPCIFANSYGSTWFDRNVTLMHELAHAIFDSAAVASIDLSGAVAGDDICEQRAQAFALEVLAPQRVLRHLAQTEKISWDSMSALDLAKLVAATHIEKRYLIRASIQSGLVSAEMEQTLNELDIHSELKAISTHALTTTEFVAQQAPSLSKLLTADKRKTTKSPVPLLLPIPYVCAVIEAVINLDISRGKAAELLMIDKRDWVERFGSLGEFNEDMETTESAIGED